MSKTVRVISPARLHFGLVNPFNRDMRLYVGAGVAIKAPSTVVEVSESEELVVTGCRSEEVLGKLRSLRNLGIELRGKVNIEKCIPKHVGLGSTTQLVLSVLRGLLEVNEIRADIISIARELGVGAISGVGTYAFLYGGFVVDAGKKRPGEFPRLLLRLEFPEDWYFVLLIPGGRGLAEEEERAFFEAPIGVDRALVWKASYHLFNELVPAIIERDFDSFARALAQLQETVGMMFREYQGGVFAIYSQKAISFLREHGVVGVGQSSWGPAVYGVVNDIKEAERIAELARREGIGEAIVTTSNNEGAKTDILVN